LAHLERDGKSKKKTTGEDAFVVADWNEDDGEQPPAWFIFACNKYYLYLIF
jgi:hypothetical protein